jgi:hypothetical protein
MVIDESCRSPGRWRGNDGFSEREGGGSESIDGLASVVGGPIGGDPCSGWVMSVSAWHLRNPDCLFVRTVFPAASTHLYTVAQVGSEKCRPATPLKKSTIGMRRRRTRGKIRENGILFLVECPLILSRVWA